MFTLSHMLGALKETPDMHNTNVPSVAPS